MEPRQRASGEQFAMLLEYMERHGDLAKPQMGAQGRLRGPKMWSELATLLNSVGGGVAKPGDKWKKVWADWKTKTTKKHRDIRHHASNGTGGGPSSRRCLTACKERVVAVLGVSDVSDLPSLPEHGFNTAPPPVLEYAFDVEDVVVEVPFSPALPDSPPHPPPLSSPLPLCSSSPFPPPPFSQLSPPLPSPPPPSSLLPPPSSFLPLSSPQRRQRTPARRKSSSPRRDAEPRRNRGLTPIVRMVQVFGSIEQSRLEVEKRRLGLEVEREKRRLELEAEREKRRLQLEDEREKRRLQLEERRLEYEERRLEYEERREIRLHERDVLNTVFMQKLVNNNERFLGSSPPLSPPLSPPRQPPPN